MNLKIKNKNEENRTKEKKTYYWLESSLKVGAVSAAWS